ISQRNVSLYRKVVGVGISAPHHVAGNVRHGWGFVLRSEQFLANARTGARPGYDEAWGESFDRDLY
ncbi:MAG TPA: hypothetical protein PKE55_08420, partial [Kiritimatiellia bacterium]|nr:hypothetical protein [Kiritimatiellia bacterium]